MAGIKFDFTGDNKNLLNSAKQAQTGVVNAINSIERAGKGIESTFSSIKNSVLGGFTDIAKGMAGLTALMQGGNFIKELIADAGKFKVAMKEVSTLSEDVAANLQKYVDQVADMTTQIPIGATEAAKALYQIESAGHHGADGLNVLRESAKGAIGGVTDTATTADAITTILNAYNMEASEAQHVSDLLFTTVRLGKTNMSQLGTTIAQVAPVAASFGVSIEDVLAAIASLTKQGTKTSVAVRQVRDAITATTKSMGDGAFQGRSFLDAMDEVAQKAQGSNNALRQDLGTLQALNAVLALTGKNSQAARQDVADMQNSAGAAEAAYQKMASTAGTQVTLLRNNIFKAILPLADEMRAMSGDIARYMNEAFDSGVMDKALVSLEAFIAAYATYRGMLAASTAWNTAALGGTYKAQIAELQKLIPLKELDGQADLQAAVAKGTLTTEQAKLVASLRAETEARYEEVVAAETEARANLKALTAAEASATANVTAAEEMVASAQARLVAATQSGVATEIETAKEELNTAEMLRNDAVRKKTIITRQMEGAQTMVSVTSKNAETAATLMNTTQQGVNATATGILATAKLHLAAAIDAVNASFLASPLFWIAAAIAGVTFAVYKLVTAETANEEAIRKANEAMDEQKKKLDERKSTIEGLLRTISDPNATDYQKIKAYDALKQVASDLTDAYSREALATMEAAKAQKILNESMDEAEYNGLVEEVKKAEKAYKDALAAREAAKTSSEYGYYDPDADYSGRELAKAKKQLEVVRAALKEAERIREEARKAADDAATPIEIRIEAAKENEAEQKRIFDFYDDVMSRVDDIQDSHNKLNFDEAKSKLDDYISEVEAELADLHTQAEQNPIDKKIQLKEEEKTNLLNKLLLWKQQMATGGYTTIPLMFKANWGSAKAALNAATSLYQNLLNQTTVGDTKSMADLYKAAKTDYETALKEWKRVSNKKNAPFITQEEYNKAKTNLATAKSSFEDVGGDPDGKLAKESKRKAEEQAKETAARHQKQLEEEWKYQASIAKVRREASESRVKAEIAQIADDSERERAERAAEYGKTRSAIASGEEELYKTIYEARKKEYELLHQGLKYEGDARGSLGWGKEVMEGTLDSKEMELYKAWMQKIYSELSALDADHAREEKRRREDLVRDYQSYTDRRLEIEKKYRESTSSIERAMAEARKSGDMSQAEALGRSLGEAARVRLKSLSDVALEEFRDSPLFSLAWKDLGSVSTEVLETLVEKFKEVEGEFSGDPASMREWTERIAAMGDELQSRNPFKSLAKASEELDLALLRQSEERGRIEGIKEEIARLEEEIALDEKSNSANERTIKNKEELCKKQEELKTATAGLGNAISSEAEARGRQKKAWTEAKSDVDALAGAVSGLGDAIGGEAGQILQLMGSVTTFATTAIDGLGKVSSATATSMSVMEKASVILTIVSAAIQLVKQISDLIPDVFGEYEKYRDKVNQVTTLENAVRDYERAVLEAKNAESSWFGTSGVRALGNQWKLSNKARADYFKELTKAQATYQDESGSGWLTKLGAQANKTIASITGAVNKALGFGGSWLDKSLTETAQFAWAAGTGGPVGAGMYAENKFWGKGWDKDYVEGLTEAWKNLRIETRAASKGFLGTGIGGHSQKTEDLVDWVKRELGLDLFDDEGWLDDEAYESIMKNYSEKLVGETEATLKTLKEFKDEHDKFLEELREYVNELYSPLMGNFSDAMWEWFDDGKDALDSFREAAGETFRKIVDDLLQTQMLKLFGDEMSETLSGLYEDYFDKGSIGEEELLAGVSKAVDDASRKFSAAQPVLEQTLTMAEDALGRYGMSMKESEDYAEKLSVSFGDALSDMSGDVDDFAKAVKKKMYEAMLDVFVYNSPFETIVDGEKQTFESFYAYLEDWKQRVEGTVKGTDLSWSEKLTAEDAEARMEYARRIIASYEALIADATDESEIEALRAKIAEVESIIAEIESGQSMTPDARREERLEGYNAELRQSYELLKDISKTYAELSGWGIEAQIESSPFSGLSSDILSFANDSSKSLSDWKDEIVKLMTEDLVKELVLTPEFKEKVRELQEAYVGIMSDESLSGEERSLQLQSIADEMSALASGAKSTAESVRESMVELGSSGVSSFGDLHATFMDALLDTERGAETLSKNLRETMVKDLIEKSAFAGFDEYQEEWTVRYLKALESGDRNLVEELVRELEERAEAMGSTVKDLVESLKDAAHDTTITDMESDFVSALMDMGVDIEDFANDMKKTIVRKLVESFMVSEQIKPMLATLQSTLDYALGRDDLTMEEKAELVVWGDAEHNGINDFEEDMKAMKSFVDGVLTSAGYSMKESTGDLAELFNDLGARISSTLTSSGGDVESFVSGLADSMAEELSKSYMATDEFQEKLKALKQQLREAVESGDGLKMSAAKESARELYKEVELATESVRELGTEMEKDSTISELTGSWVSNLMDFNATAEDWAEEIGQTMAQKIIEQMIVPTMIQPLLDNIQKAFNDAMATNTTSDAEGNAVYNWKGVLNDEGLKASITALQDAYPELKDVVQQILSLSGVKPDFSNSLDSIGDTLLDRLLSLDDDVEDIGKQIGQTLIREMLEQMLSTGQYADRIAAIKKMWQAILTGEDTEHTIEDVLKDIEQLENDITNPDNSDFSGLIAKYKSLADVAKEGFSDLRGAFLSSLIDMNGDAETFGKSIGRTMLEQMLDAYVERTYKEQIAAINKEWAEALQSGNTDALERIKQKVQELYSTISTDVEVSNIADAIKELDKQLDTTFSDMADSWASALMDMEGTAEDWAQSVGKMIAEKIIKSMVIPTMIQPILDTMQKAWNAAAEQEGATYQTMLDAMMPYLSDLVGAYEELRPIADYILNSLGVYKETVEEVAEEVAEEVEYHLQDLKSNFVSSLMDMEQSAEDWSESISKIMAEAFIKDFVLGAFDAQMKDWQAHYESILNSGLSEEDRLKQMKLLRDAIVSAKEGYVEQAMAIQELMGLNAASSSQSATANIADKITYEQADQLLGINMAQEMTLEQILYTLRGGIGVTGVGLGLASSSNADTARQIESTLSSMGGLTSSDSETIREIRGLIIIGNSYLYDIKTSNEQMLRQFGERLESIDGKIGQIF